MSTVLTPAERRALRRAVHLLELDRARFALSALIGTLGLASAIALSGTAAWLIARASRMPDLVALGVAPVMVRLFGISRAVLRYCERLVSHDTALRGMTALRTRLYQTLAASRADVVAGLRRGDVLARVGADVDAVGDLVVRAWLPAAVAAGTGALTALAVGLIHPPAGLALGACLLLAGIAGPLVTIRSARAAELARTEQAADLSATLLTALEHGGELNVAGRMPAVMKDLEDLEHRLAAARDRAGRPAAAAAAIDAAAAGLAVLGGLLTGLPAVASGALDGVWLAVIVLVPLSAFEATAALGPAAVQLIASAGAAVRIVELTDRAEASTAGPARPLPPAPIGGSRLRARGLAVGWPGGPIVAEGIDLDLGPGDRLAVVGPSGIGKTTLLLTLAGMLQPRAGEVTLDGVAPWGAARDDVAGRVSLTAEDAHVFSTSVLENLRVARGSVSRPEAAALLARAGLGPWLDALPEGLDTTVGPDATTLSGGERRRLLLARALAAPAPLMLLDEPGEHLDAPTADRLVADLLDADASRGVLLVTHRLSALAGADQVLVMGRPAPDRPAEVLRRATHAALADHDDAYRWALSQEDEQ
ncbi:ABC transporter [Actinomyces sp. oral taxon 414]|uniref:thiol reductant ABC exporter subunit CydC n=1 Tax=Actinomyces sp. oral taxon 414 TaxID=712122 RepID=UPI0006AEE371|nr:thiol reductant ABC exporter subunit CydC [Actinomyces sp. oral taxon 414]ALC98967.1 ABC transporter [Actinomyces sp. oral taxon 414]